MCQPLQWRSSTTLDILPRYLWGYRATCLKEEMYDHLRHSVSILEVYVKEYGVDHGVHREEPSQLVTNDQASSECVRSEGVRAEPPSILTEQMQDCYTETDGFITQKLFCAVVHSSCHDNKIARRRWTRISKPKAHSDIRIAWMAASLEAPPYRCLRFVAESPQQPGGLTDYFPLNSVALVSKRTIPTERPPLSAK
jgi:hypothetical protein